MFSISFCLRFSFGYYICLHSPHSESFLFSLSIFLGLSLSFPLSTAMPILRICFALKMLSRFLWRPSSHPLPIIPTKLDPYNFLPCFLPSTSFTTSISRWYDFHLNCWNDLRVLTLKAIKATLFLGSWSIIHSLETIDRNHLGKSQNIIHSMLYQTRSHTSTNRQLEEHWTKITQSLRTGLEALLK